MLPNEERTRFISDQPNQGYRKEPSTAITSAKFPPTSPAQNFPQLNFKRVSSVKHPNEDAGDIEIASHPNDSQAKASPVHHPSETMPDTAHPFHNSVYFKLSDIARYLCKKIPKKDLIIKDYFQEPNIYGLHSNLPYALATNCHNYQRTITIQKSVYETCIVPELAKLLNVDASKLLLVPGELSSLYRDVVTIRLPDEDTYESIVDSVNRQNKKKYKSTAAPKSESKRENRHRCQSYAYLMEVYKNTVFICFDLEWHERDSKKILEFGWCVWSGQDTPLYCSELPGAPCTMQKYDPGYVDPKILTRHYIVKEYFGIRNRTFVEDMKFDFLYGKSMVASQQEIKRIFEDEWRALSELYSVAFVGHGVTQDITQLKYLDIHIPYDALIFDTNTLHKTVFGGGREVNLRDLVKQFGRDPLCLHNAGNDSYYTTLCFREFTQHIPNQKRGPETPVDPYKLYRPIQIPIHGASDKVAQLPVSKK